MADDAPLSITPPPQEIEEGDVEEDHARLSGVSDRDGRPVGRPSRISQLDPETHMDQPPLGEGDEGGVRLRRMSREEERLLSRLNNLERMLNEVMRRRSASPEDFEDRGTRRLTMTRPVAGGRDEPARAKLAPPPTFDGRYKEEYNVLNWIMTVERYLYNCNKGEAVFSSYAYTYLDKEVQVWFDHRFLSTPLPPWEEMTAAMIKRYLPLNHSSRLVRRFTGIRQVGSLMQYVDRFQNLLSALGLAGIQKSSTKCIGQFIDGLKEQEDRKTPLLRKPTTMEECYELVTQILGAKLARP